MIAVRSGNLFIRIAILILLVCLGVLFLAASIMSRKYSEAPDESSAVQSNTVLLAS